MTTLFGPDAPPPGDCGAPAALPAAARRRPFVPMLRSWAVPV